MTYHKLLLSILFCCITANASSMPSDSSRVYTLEQPLVYEDVWDLWPYSFLNEDGKPEGFNIDLIRMMLEEMNIPYVIKLKPSSEAFNDLKSGRSDLMLGLAVGFHDEFGKYSKNAVTNFTQSVVTPKKKPVEIKRFRDLAAHKVIVNDSSLCHHLMIEYGWSHNAEPVEDMREAIQRVSLEEEGQIVWNTLSLKWLMQRYHTDNLQLTPVNMQHGQYKFMSNDTRLLKQLDETYTLLYSAGKLTPLHNRWFYPERQSDRLPYWLWYLAGGILLLTLVAVIYTLSYRLQARRLTRENERRQETVRKQTTALIGDIDRILAAGTVRLASYSPTSHTLTLKNRSSHTLYALTQTRCMTLLDTRHSKVIMHLFNDLDNRMRKTVDISVRSTLRVGNIPLELRFVMEPVTDAKGTVCDYQGICLDISEERNIDEQTQYETAKIQEVEDAKNSFTKNMVQEIRTPMSTISRYVAMLNETTHNIDEVELCEGILTNADTLLHLIDNILYLSRLEAHMVEISRQTYDFAILFAEQCEKGWQPFRNDHTRYVVEEPYEQLMIDIDTENVGNAIRQMAANAALHTAQGVVRARYEYIGRRLLISMDDTGEGIPQDELDSICHNDGNPPTNTKGLGLAICQEVVRQMGGHMEISSEIGLGNTIYMMIPCQATVVKRKKIR